MSVILDALHKARGDKKKHQSETHPNSVAKVLEPAIAQVETRQPGRNWLLTTILVLAGLCVLTVLGGAIFLLYDQIRKLETRTEVAAAQAAQAPPPAPAAQPAPQVHYAILPPPVPLADLPVQTPAPTASASAMAAVTDAAPATAAPATTNEEFNLGSIACEGSDCIANLNNRTVRVGDKVRGYEITAIEPTTLTMRHTASGKEMTLDLY